MDKNEKVAFVFAHFALFVVFVWFGGLKIIFQSPANPLVDALLQKTMPFIPFDIFITYFGIFEVIIGILFIIPRAEKVALLLLAAHMCMTIMPLFLLPEMSWQRPFVPTLEGQYIIKNIVIIALAASILVDMRKARV